MQKLRILAVGNRHSGVTYHRLALPLSLMEKEYLMITDTITEEIIKEKQINIVIVNRYFEGIHWHEIQSLKAKFGFKLVVDIDDHWDLNAQHIMRPIYIKNSIPSLIKYNIKTADLVTTTNSRLWAEIIKINKKCEILPNGLPFDKDQFVSLRHDHDKVNFVHTGSVTHLPDLAMIKNPMRELSKSKSFSESAKMILCGYNKANSFQWDQMASHFTAGGKLDHAIFESLPTDLYMNFYNVADVLVAPLLLNKFNSMKSNLKALEAGAKNIPIMTCDRDPYLDIPTIFRVDDWERDMKRMAFSKQMRDDFGQSNGEYVRKHFDIFKLNEDRSAIYKGLLNE